MTTYKTDYIIYNYKVTEMMSLTKPKTPASRSRGRVVKISSLYKVTLPERIEAAELGLFFDKVDMQNCPAGTMLFTPEDSGERLYILKQGDLTPIVVPVLMLEQQSI